MKAKNVEANPLERAARRRLRVAAGAAYAASTVTIRQLQNHAQFRSVPVSTLERWSRADGWAAKRTTALNKAAENADAKILASVGKAMEQELAALLELRELALQKLRDPELRPRSWESAATVLLEIMERLTAVAERTGGPKPLAAAALPPGEKLDPQFVREFARAYTKKVRDELRARLKAEANTGDVPENAPAPGTGGWFSQSNK